MRRYPCPFVLVTLAAALAACGAGAPSRDVDDAAPDASIPSDDAAATDAVVPTDAVVLPDGAVAPPDSREAFCAGSGPVVGVGDGTAPPRCAGSLAEHTFLHALCACGDAHFGGAVSSDSFDSSLGGYTSGEPGGAVGINGSYSSGGSTDVGWVLAAAGAGGIHATGPLSTRGDLVSTSGPVSTASVVRAGRDAWVHGALSATNSATIARDFYQPPGAERPTRMTVGGTIHTMDFTLPPPCPCNPSELIDTTAFVRAAQAHNDNGVVPLDPATYAHVAGGVDLTLPCGRFYLDSIDATGAMHVAVSGRTALFIGGDVSVGGGITFDVGTAGELDVFLAGNLSAGGGLGAASPDRPAALRIYVGGTGTLAVGGGARIVGNVYAPRSTLDLGGAVTLYGSAFVGSVTGGGSMDLHYDRAILHAGDACEPPPPRPAPDGGAPGMCGSCHDCRSSQACVDGACGPCRTDADCCAPLACSNGMCVAAPG